MKLNNESKTLFIPLYGKAMMSQNNLFLCDKKAEEIVAGINYDFANLKQSKWLSMYMALRASIIDEMCNQYMEENSQPTIIHLGCGLDSRICRINSKYHMWYDIDFESVISLRKHYYQENEKYKMIGKSVTDLSWLQEIDNVSENILIIAEGLTMYLSEDEMKNLADGIQKNLEK
jgi:O-methyltransferase involved in polyketide biosynthesis